MQTDRGPYLDYLARCEQAFRPFAPISLPDFFKGRADNVTSLQTELRTSGRQVAIYGERGVGKTSLAMLADFFARFNDETTHMVRCQVESTYDSIFEQLLLEAGLEYVPETIETEARRQGGLAAGPASITGAKSTRTRGRAIVSAQRLGPSLLLRRFAEQEGLLIIDEYDRVQDKTTHTRLAETLKHFSDAASKTKIIVVGVAETLAELVGEHQSLTRCLAEIQLDRMTGDELSEIISAGEERAGVTFQEGVRQKIIALSDGFPFYTHLLSKYSADEAGRVLLDNPEAKPVVSEPEYRKALQKAVTGGEATLRDAYRTAVITVKRKTEMYKNVLWAVAYSQSHEVQVQEIADNIGLLTGKRPRHEGLSNYLGPLTKPEKKEVLVRVRQGYYKFANPLMRAYIRLILEEHNISLGGQLLFPWMRQIKPRG
ncbi:MAG: ATP-binding protein [Phycisphaerae bacterium]|nr:ATP-binding protein [Phycisphaerae bacterium]